MKKYKKNKKIKLNYIGVTIMVISVLLLRSFNKTYALPTPTKTTTAETTESRRPVGHKVDGAEYYDYLDEYDKHRIIITEGGGDGGEGGNGSGGNSSGGTGTGRGNMGNGGTGNSQGGSGGGFIGSNIGGTGSGNNGLGGGVGSNGSTGANTGSGGGQGSGYDGAAALRNLIKQIEESRAESYARILETANDKNKAMESIRQKESEQESIKKEKAQESLKQRFYGEEFVKESLVPVEAEKNYEEHNGPPESTEKKESKNTNNARFFFDFSDFFNNVEDNKKPEVVDHNISEPTTSYQNSNIYDDDTIMPSEEESQKYDLTEDELSLDEIRFSNLPETLSNSQQNAQYVRPLEPQDFIEETERETASKAETKETLEPTADPYEKEETVNENKEETLETKETETESEEGRGENESEENHGAEGGKERDKEEDKAGTDNKDNQDSDEGGGGSGQGTSDGKTKNIKIFEIDAVGGIGAGESSTHIDLMKLLMNIILIVCFILGFVFHYADIGYKREIKKGYF